MTTCQSPVARGYSKEDVMARKEQHKRKPERKLALKKETLRDLTAATAKADTVRGGRGRLCTWIQSGC
jgi:hypothetical protein